MIRKMLQVGEVWGSLRVLPLLRGKVVLKEGLISNVNAMLLKPSKEAPANYQFVIDSLKPKKKTHKKSFFSIDIRHAQVRDIKVTYNDQEASIDKAVYTFWRDEHRLTIDQSTLSWERKTKKGMTAYDLNSGVITIVYHEKGEKKLNVAGMTIKTDNHLPRKNTGKPHRGWFD